MANSEKDGFTLVKGGRHSKTRKADGSPLLQSLPRASSASPINTSARPKPSTYKNSVPIILNEKTPLHQPQDKIFTFSAEQLVKFVANVAIQVAQPQVCYISYSQDAIDKKSCMCRRVSEAAKTHLDVDIAGSILFDAIGHLRPSCAICPQTKNLP